MAKLITDQFGGNQAEFARAIKRQPTVVWQYLSDRRKIGEDFARHVERALRLPALWLDQEDESPSPTARLVGKHYSAPGVGVDSRIADLLTRASPKSQAALEHIAQAAAAGKLTEADLELLEQIARRFEAK